MKRAQYEAACIAIDNAALDGKLGTGKMYDPNTGCFCSLGAMGLAIGIPPENMTTETAREEYVSMDAIAVEYGLRESGLVYEPNDGVEGMTPKAMLRRAENVKTRLLLWVDDD